MHYLGGMNETTSAVNKSQERAINRVLSYYKDSCREDVYAITHEIKSGPYFISLTVRADRTDCEPYSPRAVLCNDGGYFFIGPRGKITVNDSYRLEEKAARENTKKHIAFMVGGQVGKW